MGLPMGLQFSITAIGSMVMQAANNGLGKMCIRDREVAERLNVPVSRVREVLKISRDPVSLDTPIGEEDDSHPVSYTHLDVYKRQIMRSSLSKITVRKKKRLIIIKKLTGKTVCVSFTGRKALIILRSTISAAHLPEANTFCA